jgi:hypothetical protein
MILPTKHIKPADSLLGVGAALLEILALPRTVTELWENARTIPGVGSFERFALGLDLLYAMDLVENERGMLRRRTP